MKKILLIATAVVLGFAMTRCSSGTSTPLSAAGKMASGMGGAVNIMKGMGNAMGGSGTFALNQKSIHTMSAATKCTVHAEPGTDANSDGVVSDSERMSNSDVHYALQKFYCTLASDSTGPESISGAVSLIKTIACAIDKQIAGGLPFDNNPIAITGITLDLTCATQAQINNMSNTVGQNSAVVAIAGGATVTSALNPTFAEIPGNTHYSHGIKIASNDGTSLKFIILAKFNSTVGNPIESGDFEFATMGTGTIMQGTAIEFTAGKVYGTGVVKHLWYEARSNRAKTSGADPICPGTSGSCGFSRHIRISTDLSFVNGDIDTVSNMSGLMTDGGDSTGSSGQMDNLNVVTATGNLATGLTGKFFNKAVAPSTLTGASTLGTTFVGGEIGTTTCIMSAGTSVTTSCGLAPAPLAPTGAINTFFSPANTSTWLVNASTHGGLGFTGAVTFADTQYAQ